MIFCRFIKLIQKEKLSIIATISTRYTCKMSFHFNYNFCQTVWKLECIYRVVRQAIRMATRSPQLNEKFELFCTTQDRKIEFSFHRGFCQLVLKLRSIANDFCFTGSQSIASLRLKKEADTF